MHFQRCKKSSLIIKEEGKHSWVNMVSFFSEINMKTCMGVLTGLYLLIAAYYKSASFYSHRVLNKAGR